MLQKHDVELKKKNSNFFNSNYKPWKNARLRIKSWVKICEHHKTFLILNDLIFGQYISWNPPKSVRNYATASCAVILVQIFPFFFVVLAMV